MSESPRKSPLAQAASRSPRIRECPEDFEVDEIPLYQASGRGEHTFVRVEKRLRTTEQVARALARAAGVSAAQVGYAGRKDRVAVTRQWFSVPGLLPEQALALELDGARVLTALPHPHKLRTGQLRANRFTIRVRGVDAARAEHASRRLEEFVSRGMPNRYGSQRFGRDASNAARGRALLVQGRRSRDRRADRFLVSALQAEVFNRVLACRPLPLDSVECGDVARVCASGGLFVVEDLARENERARRFEISPTGPIFGTRVLQPSGAAAEREAAVMTELGLEGPLRPPRGLRLRGARRPLRVRPEEAALDRQGDDMTLRCALPAGSYVTVLLEELFGKLDEGRGAGGVAKSR